MSNIHLYLGRYIYLKNLTLMKIHRSGLSEPVMRKRSRLVPRDLDMKVTLDSYSVELYLFEILDSSVTGTRVKRLSKQLNIIVLMSLEPELGKVTLRSRDLVIQGHA